MSGHGAALVGSMAIVAVVLAGCGGGDESTGPDPAAREAAVDLRIGDLVPLTGELAASGPAAQKAADMALGRIRMAIDTAGARDRVTLEHRDEGATPDEALDAAGDLVDDGAQCMVGPWSSAAEVAEEVSIPARIVQITPAGTADEISELSDDGLVSRTALPGSSEGPALARAIAAALGGAAGTTVNLGTRNDVDGIGLSKAFADAWEDEGGSLGEEVVYDPDQPDYEGEAAQLVSGDPDAVVIVDALGTFAELGPALIRTGLYDSRTTWVAGGLGSGGAGPPSGAGTLDGMRVTGPGAPASGPDAAAFDRLFESSRPASVRRQIFDAQTFDAVILCYLAAVAAGSTHGPEMAEALPAVTSPGGERYTWRQLPRAVEALRGGADIDFQGASGPIDLDSDGDPTAGTYLLYRYERGRPEVVGEVPVDRTED